MNARFEGTVMKAMKTYDRWVPPVIETEENGSQLLSVTGGVGAPGREERRGWLTGGVEVSARERGVRLDVLGRWADSLGFGTVGLAD